MKIVIITIALIIILWVIVLLWRQKKGVEGFSSNIKDDQAIRHNEETKQKLRNSLAIESCDVLQASPNAEMDGDAEDTMNRILKGHRLNKFKSNEVKNDNVNKEFCYMYNDEENNMKDYLLIEGCSKENNLFKNTPFITNVFETEQKDATHTIPLKKCVIEIDKTKVDTEQLNPFWQKWKLGTCTSITDPIRNQIRQTFVLNNTLSHNLSVMKAKYNIMDNEAQHKQADLTVCTTESDDVNTNLQRSIALYNQKYDILKRNQSEYENLRKNLSEMNDRHTLLEKSFSDFQDKYKEKDALKKECDEKLRECQRKEQKEEDELISKRNHQNFLTGEFSKYDAQRREVEDNFNRVSSKNSVCQSNRNTVEQEHDIMKENYLREKSDYDACNVARRHYESLFNTYKEKANQMKENKESCIEERGVLRGKMEECNKNREKCRYLQNKHLNTYKRLIEAKERKERCLETEKRNIRIKETLEEQNTSLHNRLETAKAETHVYEKTLNENQAKNINNITQNSFASFGNYIKSIENEKIKQLNCKEKSELVKKIRDKELNIARLKFQLESIKKQKCAICDPTPKQCAEKFPRDDNLCDSSKHAP